MAATTDVAVVGAGIAGLTTAREGFHAGVLRDEVWRHVDLGSATGPLRSRLLGLRDKASLLRTAAPMLLARPADLGDLVSMRRFDTRSAGHAPRTSTTPSSPTGCRPTSRSSTRRSSAR
ncbi:MAG TPA: hypothetical protein VGH76_10100 [Actinomycetospora sp.]|jgi:hypothetical protein|uniref:hypothetical protein n=1 Tax=Actinomycetospora sp. TaxID=1872135 RepID=UPI002F4088AB